MNRLVTTTIVDADSHRSSPYLMRSYDYERRHSFDKTSLLEVWQVARAATAKKSFFEPMKIEDVKGTGSMLFTDGSFDVSDDPTHTGAREVRDLHGYSSLGIVVGVGTAHTPKPDANRSSSTVPDSARLARESLADSQQVHGRMQHGPEMHKESQYFRLDYAKGLKTVFDEWEPKGNPNSDKKAGSKTISDIENAFAEWMAKVETQMQLLDCASALVARRRKRMSTRKWERYATGSVFFCPSRCVQGAFLDRDEFLCHLSEDHGLQDSELVDEVREARRQWRGPTHAYHFGNTIIVEDEDGEVVKKYERRPQPKQRRGVRGGAQDGPGHFPAKPMLKRAGT